MGQSTAMSGLLLLAFLLANMPFAFPRLLGLGPDKRQHPAGLLLELALSYALLIGLGRALEQHYGQIAPQAWQFYAVSLCLFLCMAFPGFVWRYLLKK